MSTLPASFDPAAPGAPALIVVKADWCGHCKTFVPEVKRMRPHLRARVYVVDGDADPRVKGWKVEGYPTVLFRPAAGGLFRYDGGDRSLAALQRFMAAVSRRD